MICAHKLKKNGYHSKYIIPKISDRNKFNYIVLMGILFWYLKVCLEN